MARAWCNAAIRRPASPGSSLRARSGVRRSRRCYHDGVQSMPRPPPGISESDFQRALRELEGVVGREWLFATDEDVLLYRDGYSPLWGEAEERFASAAVAPNSVEQV